MISKNYELPPQKLGNLVNPMHRVEFVRARNEADAGWQRNRSLTDLDDIQEASTSSAPNLYSASGFAADYRKIIEESKGLAKKPVKIKKETDEDEIVIMEDEADGAANHIKKELDFSKISNFDVKDINGYLKAAKDGNLEEVRKFLTKEIPIDAIDFYGWTATMCAAAEGKFEICKYLLENGADPNVRCKNGMGILQIAQKNGQNGFMEKLLNYFCKCVSPTTSSKLDTLTFCEPCNMFIPDSTAIEHVSSIPHQLNDRNTHGAALQSGIQIGPSNIGYRLICASGWCEEQGLGRYSDGQRFPIRTMLKTNRTGLGMEKMVKKVTHFGPYDTNAVRNNTKLKPPPTKTKKEMEIQKKKEDRIAKKFRAEFAESDSVYDYFNGK